jgi:hypothetical protein
LIAAMIPSVCDESLSIGFFAEFPLLMTLFPQ